MLLVFRRCLGSCSTDEVLYSVSVVTLFSAYFRFTAQLYLNKVFIWMKQWIM